MKHKSLKVTAVATAIALAMSAVAMAAPTDPDWDQEQAANKDTTISIFSTAGSTTQVSYTVPLYVTMGVVNNDTIVKVPTNYTLINNTVKGGGDNTKVPIAVTNMSFEKLANSTYNTIETAPVANTDIQLKIGGATMPTATAAGTQAVNIKVQGSAFWDTTQDKANEINDSLDMPIEGTVMATTRTDETTAAQFRVKYTLSLVSGGKTLGQVYVGNNHNDAGLQNWHVDGTN